MIDKKNRNVIKSRRHNPKMIDLGFSFPFKKRIALAQTAVIRAALRKRKNGSFETATKPRAIAFYAIRIYESDL